MFCKWTAVETVNQKHTKMFFSYLLQNEADSDKVGTYFPGYICRSMG